MPDRTPTPNGPLAPEAPAGPGRAFGAKHLAAVAIGSAVIATSISAAFAWSPAFDDVPQSHPFESEIAWMKATGISTGYAGSGSVGRDYRPNDPVTRQAMAAFMQRLYDLDGQRRFDSGDIFSVVDTTAWTDVPGASVSIDVPPGVAANLHATFSGESACFGAVASTYCKVRILVDPPGPIPPAVLGPDDTAVAFDSTDSGTEGFSSWESHSIDRFDTYVADAGTYTLTVQVAVSAPGTTFDIDDWVLMAETDLEPTTFVGDG